MITMQPTQELGRSFIRRRLFRIIVLFSITLQGCGILPRRDAVPPTLTKQAVTSVCPGSRYWPNLELAPLFQNAIDSDDRERAALSRAGEATQRLPAAYYLAISGGGDEGAF